MKKLLIIIICSLSITAFAQEHRHHGKKDRDHKKKDYFTAGLYVGTYIAQNPLQATNAYFNSITGELEYFKFSDLSLVVRGTYQFSTATLYNLIGVNEGPNAKLNEPYTYRLNIGINGRYYLGKSKVRPYLQTGLNQETSFINNYTVNFYNGSGGVTVKSYERSYIYRYALNFGVGFNVKLGRKFSFDMKYDLYKTIWRDRGNFYSSREAINAFSLLAGIKYNL